MKLFIKILSITAAAALPIVALSAPAVAGTRPVVTSLSSHHGAYWGDSEVTVHGSNFTHVQRVLFGSYPGYAVHVLSASTLTVREPAHAYGTVHVRVLTSAGASSTSSANQFTYTRPTMDSPIQGGLTARQEQQLSAHVRATHRAVPTIHRSTNWTAAMGVKAMQRARSWLGLPYSWAGGNSHGPTLGVCAHNGGDMDCHVVGFDCSGLALNAWAPYRYLPHYAASQYSQGGRFHPTVAELVPGDLVFFSGYIASGIGHVAVYEGGGMVIQAEQSGTRVMRSRLVDVIANSGRYRGATRPMSTGRQSPVPYLSSMTTQIALKGGSVTITGNHLSEATSVSVDGKMLYSFSKRSATRLVVTVPAHRAGKAAVAVSNPWGTVRRTLTYVAAPHMSSFAPTRGPVSGGTTVTITGLNLTTVSKVTVGTTSARFHVLASNRLTVTMPPHAVGSARVALYSRFGTSNQEIYTFFVPTPEPAHITSPAPPPAPAPAPAPVVTSVPPPSTSSATTPAPVTSSAATRPTSPAPVDPSTSTVPSTEAPSTEVPSTEAP